MSTETTQPLRDHLQSRGYRRHETGHGAESWDLGESAALRVVIWTQSVHVHAFDGQVREWTAKFTKTTPEPMIVALLEVAGKKAP